MSWESFFEALWRNYLAVTPQAATIHRALADRGETVVNDHVALRTFDVSPISLAELEPTLLGLGYRRFAPYDFPARQLRAFGYLHEDPGAPRVFLSELLTGGFSGKLQRFVRSCCASVDSGATEDAEIFLAGRPWPMPTWQTYQDLLVESDYAAWLAVLGLCANHFTISVNGLRHFRTVPEIVDFVASLGFPINEEGGRIKGGPTVLLEQASTYADHIPMTFADGDQHDVPTCYYEFARRYPEEDGSLYQGFVAASANHIFASTRAAG